MAELTIELSVSWEIAFESDSGRWNLIAIPLLGKSKKRLRPMVVRWFADRESAEYALLRLSDG